MEKKIRIPKVLNPGLISKKEQLKIRKWVKEGLEAYSFEEAMRDGRKLFKGERHHQVHQHN